MDTEKDNKKVNFSFTKLTLGVAMLGVMGGVFFASFLNTQTTEASIAESKQSIIVEKSEPLSETSDTTASSEVSNSSSRSISISSNTLEEHLSETSEVINTVISETTITVSDGAPSPTAQQSLTDNATSANIAPKPSPKPSPNTNPASPAPVVDEPAAPVQETQFCPITREQNPSVYDACISGFSAPTIEWVGYHSCKKIEDPNYGTVVKLWGKVKLSGGNYGAYSWDRASDGAYGLVTASVTGAPYVIMWDATAYFESMSSKYSGAITTVSGMGTNFIDESQIPAECRF